MEICKNYSVEYAHRLHNHFGRCKNIHGHSGKIKIVFEGNVSDVTGMVVDFGDFKWLKQVVDVLDHALVLDKDDPLLSTLLKYFDENEEMRLVVSKGPPTAENFTVMLACRIAEDSSFKLLQMGCGIAFQLVSVMFEETEGNSVTLDCRLDESC